MKSEEPMIKLHCPRCGQIMTRSAAGELVCVRGQMHLARELENRFRDCYVTKISAPRDGINTYNGKLSRVGGKWFCPGCGIPAQELIDGDLRCPQCAQSLVEFVYALIERHPHI